MSSFKEITRSISNGNHQCQASFLLLQDEPTGAMHIFREYNTGSYTTGTRRLKNLQENECLALGKMTLLKKNEKWHFFVQEPIAIRLYKLLIVF